MRTLIDIVIRTVVVAGVMPALLLLGALTSDFQGDPNIGLGIILLALLLFVPMIWAVLDGRRMRPLTLATVWSATVVLATGATIIVRAAWTGTLDAVEPDVDMMTFGLMAVGACLGGLVGLAMRPSRPATPTGQGAADPPGQD